MVQLNGIFVVLTVGATLVQGHPGQSHASKVAELNRRNEFISGVENKDLAQCAGKLTKRGELSSIVERRVEALKALRRERGIPEDGPHLRVKRQAPSSPPAGGIMGSLSSLFGSGTPGSTDGFSLASLFGPKGVETAAMKKNHKSNSTVTTQTDWSVLGKDKTTILAPDVTEGPYYVGGELIRKNVRDKEQGINVTLDIQVIDMTSCKPIPKLAVEIWAANATGVYGGVIDVLSGMNPTNGIDLSKFTLEGLRSSITSKATQQLINKQALRGVLITNKDGAVQFETIIPGFYAGRTPHIHVATHIDVTVQSNKTIAGGRTPHVGQLYFDQELLDQVATIPPYNLNKNVRMKNKDDFIMQQGSAGEADPIVEYVLIGETLADGIFAWINFGVNPKAHRSIREATRCGEDGCKSTMGEVISAFGAIQSALPTLNTSALALIKDWNILSAALNNTKGVSGLASGFKEISATYKDFKQNWDTLSTNLKSLQGAFKTITGTFSKEYESMKAEMNKTKTSSPKTVPSLSNTTAGFTPSVASNMGFFAAVGAALGGLVGYLIPVNSPAANKTIPAMPSVLPAGLFGALQSASANPLPKATGVAANGSHIEPLPKPSTLPPASSSSDTSAPAGKAPKSSAASEPSAEPGSSASAETGPEPEAIVPPKASASPEKGGPEAGANTEAPVSSSKSPKSKSPKKGTSPKSTAPPEAIIPPEAGTDAEAPASASKSPKGKSPKSSAAPEVAADLEPAATGATEPTEPAEAASPPSKTTAKPKISGTPKAAAKGKSGGAAKGNKTTKKPAKASFLPEDGSIEG